MKFSERIRALFTRGTLNDASLFEDLADLLIEGDIGTGLAYEVSDELKKQCNKKSIRDEREIRLELKKILATHIKEIFIKPQRDNLNVFLLLGVNGVGKTTTCAKMAHFYMKNGLATKVLLAAADTFRAAAIDQLKVHGDRLGIRVVAQRPGSDPGAVLYDALESARAEKADVVIADTAGRMHTRQDLIRELGKIDKVVASRAAGANYRRFLAIDATTGQNGLRQAEAFKNAVPIDAIVLTKFDSSARGGIIISLAKEMGIPTAFIGKGEGYNDLVPFNTDAFLNDFLGLD